MNEIQTLEAQIMEMTQKLNAMKAKAPGTPVKNYAFQTTTGKASLLDLFAGRERLFVIHNMGQGCRYCTTWADGLNGFLPHLEDAGSVVLVSKDAPELQRTFANARGWRFRMASHGGGDYIKEQSTTGDGQNSPGIVYYERQGDQILKKNASTFGPGDLFCSLWNILALGGLNDENWTPQYSYWRRPEKMDDGGQNLK